MHSAGQIYAFTANKSCAEDQIFAQQTLQLSSCTPALILRAKLGTYLRHGAICCYEQVPLKLLCLLVFTHLCSDTHFCAAFWLLKACHLVVELDDAFIWERM